MFARNHTQLLSATVLLSLAACKIEASLPADDGMLGSSHAAAGSGSVQTPRPHAAAGAGASGAAGHGGAQSVSASGRGHAAAGGSAVQASPSTPIPGEDDWAEDARDDASADDPPSTPGVAAGGGSVPSALVGTWYASSGGTSIPFDPVTGTFGMQNGSGLLYQFLADGTYQKAFQSYASNAGCTTGFNAQESGSMQVSQSSLLLVPDGGEIHYRDNCSPSLNSDKPEDGLSPEQFTWELAGDGLRLTRSDGASSVFVRSEP